MKRESKTTVEELREFITSFVCVERCQKMDQRPENFNHKIVEGGKTHFERRRERLKNQNKEQEQDLTEKRGFVF